MTPREEVLACYIQLSAPTQFSFGNVHCTLNVYSQQELINTADIYLLVMCRVFAFISIFVEAAKIICIYISTQIKVEIGLKIPFFVFIMPLVLEF